MFAPSDDRDRSTRIYSSRLVFHIFIYTDFATSEVPTLDVKYELFIAGSYSLVDPATIESNHTM